MTDFVIRIVAVACALVLAAVSPPIAGQDAPDTRVAPPIVDPAIVGTWAGKQHISHPIRFEISDLGVFKISADFAEATLVPSVCVGVARDGEWSMISLDGRRLDGSYRVHKDGTLSIHGAY